MSVQKQKTLGDWIYPKTNLISMESWKGICALGDDSMMSVALKCSLNGDIWSIENLLDYFEENTPSINIVRGDLFNINFQHPKIDIIENQNENEVLDEFITSNTKVSLHEIIALAIGRLNNSEEKIPLSPEMDEYLPTSTPVRLDVDEYRKKLILKGFDFFKKNDPERGHLEFLGMVSGHIMSANICDFLMRNDVNIPELAMQKTKNQPMTQSGRRREDTVIAIAVKSFNYPFLASVLSKIPQDNASLIFEYQLEINKALNESHFMPINAFQESHYLKNSSKELDDIYLKSVVNFHKFLFKFDDPFKRLDLKLHYASDAVSGAKALTSEYIDFIENIYLSGNVVHECPNSFDERSIASYLNVFIEEKCNKAVSLFPDFLIPSILQTDSSGDKIIDKLVCFPAEITGNEDLKGLIEILLNKGLNLEIQSNGDSIYHVMLGLEISDEEKSDYVLRLLNACMELGLDPQLKDSFGSLPEDSLEDGYFKDQWMNIRNAYLAKKSAMSVMDEIFSLKP